LKLGIIPNTSKQNIVEVVEQIIKKFEAGNFKCSFSQDFFKIVKSNKNFSGYSFQSHEELFSKNDLIVSIGGDGTLLTTSYDGRNYSTPMLGINFGKLGFLAEYEINNIDRLITELKNGEYVIEERMTLQGACSDESEATFFAINDIVIDRGHWPKMIDIELLVDDKYVSTFSADGIIISTPTGSTGYSLSVGGPVVNPIAKAITISPISPHTLTIRPLVIADTQKILIRVKSEQKNIHVSCDGQRVTHHRSPKEFSISSSKTSIKLLRTKSTSYYDILRKKLYWGVDIRQNTIKEQSE
jgi:NAD+ kinase